MIGYLIALVVLSVAFALLVRYAEAKSDTDKICRALMTCIICLLAGFLGLNAGNQSWREYPTGQPVEIVATFQQGTEVKCVLKWGKNVAVVSQKELKTSEVEPGATYIFTDNGWHKVRD